MYCVLMQYVLCTRAVCTVYSCSMYCVLMQYVLCLYRIHQVCAFVVHKLVLYDYNYVIYFYSALAAAHCCSVAHASLVIV